MRITKIGQSWPIEITCSHHEEPVTFEVSMPEDMLMHYDYELIEVPNASWRHATVVNRHVWVKCPICDRIHEIPLLTVPEAVLKKIPLDQSNRPVLG